MRRVLSVLFILCLALALFNCGGSKKGLADANEGDVPDWFMNAPQDPNYLFAATTATSRDLQLAIDKATTSARAEIGRQTDVRIQALQKRFDEEVGVDEDAELLQSFTAATKTVVSTSLAGSRISKQKQSKDGNLWRSYVLVEYPIGAASEAMMQAIKKSQQMYTRFRATEAFKDLDTEVQKYEEFKKQQQNIK